MKTRKAASPEVGEEQQAKRRKIGQHQNIKADSLMDSLSDDCLVSILSNLPVDDLNTVAMCSRRFRGARSSDSLDQTRTGTIILSEGSTMRSLLNAIVDNNWNDVFSGNRKKLKLVGVEHLRYESSTSLLPTELVKNTQLPGVTILDASIAPTDPRVFGVGFGASNIFCLFPNLKALDMSYLFLWDLSSAAIRKHCPAVTSITWKSHGDNVEPHSGEAFQGLTLLKELCLDGFSLWNEPSLYMFEHCPRVERLSIKGCTLYEYGGEEEVESELPQEDLIDMVRNHPSLRWLRSDLSAENVAMLQQERPEMTFVSE